ncbi:high choriolytic enzyme 1-like [Nelusetta ayraudi]|uniref:high choriolytic enzyme 1-like n=1 Tax=Nelusetta ayraudi TaxID=303726 RepID=UPI003F709F75
MKSSFSLLLLLLLGLSQAHPTIEDADEEDFEDEEDDTVDITTGILTTNENMNESLLEGDMMHDKTRNAMCWNDRCLWKKRSNGKVIIPYTIDRQFSSSEKKKIRKAMKGFQRKTCIVFKKRKNGQRDYIRVVNKEGCYSSLGRQGGAQDLSLKKQGCMHHGIIQHEFIHALGFRHEHTRSDRDEYVKINWGTIKSGMQFNFKKGRTNNLNTPYDYSSIMHYGRTAFSINGRETITPNRNVRIGQRQRMSKWDLKRINRLYGC